MGNEEGEKEDIVCTDMFGNAILDDLDYRTYDAYNDDRNASDKSYEFDDDTFDAEIDKENKLDGEHGISNKEVQADYFVNHDSESESDNDEDEENEPENQEVENENDNANKYQYLMMNCPKNVMMNLDRMTNTVVVMYQLMKV